MFRKLVSGLPFSPALVGQLGFYARRLRKEELTRRLGLLFTVLAIIVQSFAVFDPPEQALASSGSDIIHGGVTSVQDILNFYDAGANGQNDYKAFLDYIGITRDDLSRLSSKVEYICSTDHSITSFGRQHHYSSGEGELVHKVPLATGSGFSTFYSVPLYRFDSVNNKVNCYDSYVGHSSKIGWFAIMRKCANLQIKTSIQKLPKGHLVSATCTAIQGYAYDERQETQSVKILLYFDGPPGQGKQYGPYDANQTTPTAPIGGAHGFNVDVPKAYQRANHQIKVWAVMQPLAGWDQPLVQFDNTLTLPDNCTPVQTPIASCLQLTVNTLDRTHATLTAKSEANSDALVTAYTFTVSDKNNAKIYDTTITSGELSVTTPTVEIKTAGSYTAMVVVKTTIGNKTSNDCAAPITISPQGNCIFSPNLNDQDSRCKPCPYKASLWIEDKNCIPPIAQSKSAKNLTQNQPDANGTTAHTADRIEYTVRVTNTGSSTTTTSVNEDMTDVVQYANLIDNGGGTYNDKTKVLSWNDVKLTSEQSANYHFVVQVLDTIPATPRGANDPAAFNCVMTNSFGNTINISVQCPYIKTIETTVKQLPSTGPGENVAFATIMLMIVTYFFARSRQIKNEVNIIRKDFNTGVL